MISIMINDDYASLDTKKYEFYFGNEYVKLSNGKYKNFDAIKEKESHLDYEWCFFVLDIKTQKIVFKKPVSELAGNDETCEENLLFGIGLFLNKTL